MSRPHTHILTLTYTHTLTHIQTHNPSILIARWLLGNTVEAIILGLHCESTEMELLLFYINYIFMCLGSGGFRKGTHLNIYQIVSGSSAFHIHLSCGMYHCVSEFMIVSAHLTKHFSAGLRQLHYSQWKYRTEEEVKGGRGRGVFGCCSRRGSSTQAS